MDKTSIIASSISAAVVLGGVALYMFKQRKWSDGTSIVYKDEAEQNILDWANQTRREFKKGGRRTKKHYK